MKLSISLVALVAAFPAFAKDNRQLDAHEHGVGTLNIAIDGTTVAMEFEAPGADIVGFEYAAESDADLAAIDAAVALLEAPLDLFVMPDAASCVVTDAHAELESEDEHEDHDEHDEEDHEDHAEEGHGDEDHDDHDEEGHDDHGDEDHDDHGEDGHEDHAEEDHDDHDHDEHAEDAGHTEFHAEYSLTCENSDALTTIAFPYFETFPNAKEVEVQIITASGAQAFEVERAAPVLDLGG